MRIFFFIVACCLGLACDATTQDERLSNQQCTFEKQPIAFIESKGVSEAVPPVLPVPSQAQLEWQRDELYMFVHFGINTFTLEEWGDGKASPDVFNPTNLDVEQWVHVAVRSGFKGIILTAKHHEGFALWPTDYSDYSVVQSPWENGQGDVVRLLAQAARRAGLKFGIYLSPWDRHEPTYGTPAYNDFFVGQLTELLTGYGSIFEVWLDSAREPGIQFEYDFERYFRTIRELQPHALIANLGPDIRWVGNEQGIVPERQFSFVNQEKWYPVECDVPIRPHWFWRPEEDQQVKSSTELLSLYFNCIGRNSALLLGVSPNQEGRMPPLDEEELIRFGKTRDLIFQQNLVGGQSAIASSEKSGGHWGARNLVDKDDETFWIAEDSVRTASVEIDVSSCAPFNVIELKEPIQYGQRIESHLVEVWVGGAWEELTEGATIGYKRLHIVPRQQASKIRITVHSDVANPALEDVGLYYSKKLGALNKLRKFKAAGED